MNRKIALAVTSLAVIASAAIPQTASAARFQDREHFVARFCDSHPGERDCRDWRDNRQSWNSDRYHRWYGRHRHDFGPEDAAAALFGFAAGAASNVITGSVRTVEGGSHVAACEARYRSYNPDTDMFRGMDGDWHYCRL
jgi:hypothetical protein